MKRFTLTLSLLLVFVTVAMAQFNANKYYTVVAEGHSKGGSPAWAVSDDGTSFVSTGNTTVSDDAQKNFTFIKFYGAGAGTTAANYIYSVWAKKFVKNDASLAADAPQAVTIQALDDGKYLFKFDDEHFINIGGEKQMTIDDWGTGTNEVDGGNTMTVSEAGDFSIDDLREAIAPLYVPTYTGDKTKTSRMVGSISVNNNVYTMPLNTETTRKSYTDITDEKTFTANAGADISLALIQSGTESWMNAFVYIDMDNDGFTAGISSDSYTPTGDLVSYSFYNNGASSDVEGWNSVGTEISDNSRNTVYLPNATAPTTPGTYRIRFKYDWCSIDPYGADGTHFNQTLEGHGGEIIDATLVVLPALSAEATTAAATLRNQLDIIKVYYDAGLIGEHTSQYSSSVFDDPVTIYESGETFYWNITSETEVSAINSKITNIETLVNSLVLNMPKSGAVYTFETVDRGWWASGTSAYLYSTEKSGASVTTANASASNEACQWVVYQGSKGQYIYNVAAGKFVTLGDDVNSIPLADYPNNSTLTFKESTSDGYPYLVGLDNKAINLNKQSPNFVYGALFWVDGWNDEQWSADPGSAVRITYVKDADVETLAQVAKAVSAFEDAPYTLNVGATGYASLYLGFDATIPDGVEAYIATATGIGYVHMDRITGTLPAKTAVVIKATANTSYEFVVSAGAETVVEGGATVEDNLLLGTTTSTYIYEDAYVLSAPDGAVAFHLAEMNQENGTAFINYKNRVYMPKSVASAAAQGSASFRFVFGTTGIEEITEQRAENKEIYDLQGRKLNEITAPGMYIVNGCKVFVK